MMHRAKSRSRWHLIRHSLLFVSFRRASDSLLPVLRRTRQDSIQSNAPWETQIDFWNFSSDIEEKNLTRSMPTMESKPNFNDLQRLVQHLKNYDQFLLDYSRRKDRTFSEFILNDLSFPLTSLPKTAADLFAKRTSQIEKNQHASTVKSVDQPSPQFISISTMEHKEKHLMQKLFEGKKTAYSSEQHRMESTRIRKYEDRVAEDILFVFI